MRKKEYFLIAVFILLIGFILYLNRDWFTSEKIQISHRSGPAMRFANPRFAAATKTVNPILFEFNRKLNVTSIKVIPLSDFETNKYAHPIWELVPTSKPVATRGFEYGVPIPGMKPSVQGALADPLQPGVTYRLIIEAGSLKAQHDFTPAAKKS